ncbi:MAG TPA: hypothetical protein VFE96_05595 [Candidatus Bathyarchaeia archaeon]|jgi:hypothetical protein|nr:hypothetical protein [Candidatus Bathyarchaeia archaeon]
MVFLHGTTIGEEKGVDLSVGHVSHKLQAWKRQGAEIVYLTHRRKIEDIEKEKLVLAKHDFPKGPIFYREKGEEYRDVAERVRPDLIVEDDCKSIGGEREMTYPHIRPEIKARIKSIVVKEGSGIDHLPDDLELLI